MSPFKNFFIMTGIQLTRYLVFAGGAYLVIWKLNQEWAEAHRIQNATFRESDLRREIGYSLVSSLIFGGILALAFRNSYTATLPQPTSWTYDTGCLIGLILFHDTYFYWMHRLVHHPKLFGPIHRVHHLSTNPSPWAALAFQPAEALLEIAWVLPVHALVTIQPKIWIVFAFIMILINVIGHLGVEAFPKRWLRHPVMKWLNFPTMHNRHHQFFTGNYGLYFSFWDRVMGTLRKDSGAA